MTSQAVQCKRSWYLCGIEYEADWGYISTRNMILWPLDMGHPILNVPNSDMSFTKVTSVWANNYDIGDLVRIGQGGDARLLLGRSSDRPDVHGALTTCLNNHLILQTFGTHQFGEETMTKNVGELCL